MPERGRAYPAALPGLGLFAVALGLRLLHAWQIGDAPFAALLLGDEASYDRWAREIAAGAWWGGEVFYQAPLYPYVLAIVYTLFGTGTTAVRILQAVLGAAACVLLAGAGRRLINRRTGLVAGLLLAFYPPALFYEARLDKSALDVLFVCLVLCLVAALVRAPRPALGWAVGAALGALALTRENALLLIAAVLLWLAWSARRGVRGSPRIVVFFLVGLFCVLSPVILRNAAVGGGLHLTTSQLGPNLYIGNNPDANGTYRPLRHGRGTWIHERSDATELARLAEGRDLSPSEVSRFWTRRALSYIASEPMDWLGLKLRTLSLLWNRVEIGDSEDPYTHAERSAAMRWVFTLLHFGTLAPLALLGLCITWRRRDRLLPLYLMGAAYGLSLVLFYVVGRYRYPLVPFLALFAAAGIVGVREWWRHATPRVTGSCLAITVLFAVFCNWPLLSTDAMRAVTRLNIADGLAARGDLDPAIFELQRSIELRPDFEIAHYNLGNLLRARGRELAAIEHYRRAVELEPRYFEAYNNWGNVLLNRGRLDQAAEMFRRVLQIDPRSVPAMFGLGETLRLAGDAPAAADMFQRALDVRPDHAPSRRRLAELDAVDDRTQSPGTSSPGG